MAKIRIYELARDLNMTNRDLLMKLKEMEIAVNSHMSALEDDDVEKIKAYVSGKKSPSLEEIRVRPTVIRRRKKIVAIPEQEEPTVEELPEELSEEIHEEISEETYEELQEESSEVAVEEEEIAAEPEELPEPVLESAASAEALEVEVSEKVEPAPIEVQAPAEPEVVEPPVPYQGAVEAQATFAEEAQEPLPPPIPMPAKPEAKKKERPAIVTKKAKKEAPAKIIKLPVQPPPEPAEAPATHAKAKAAETKTEARPKQVFKPTVPAAPAPAETAEAAGKDKKKKGKKRVETEDLGQDKKFFKKKIAFRKKEVVEGKDLYVDQVRPKKARKGAKVKEVPAAQKTQITVAKAIKRRVRMDDTIVLSELAKRMGIKAGEMIAKLMGLGVMVTVNQTIDFDTAVLVATEFEYEVEKATFEEDTILKVDRPFDPAELLPRPPVVTIMGHVDHGKTSLLDVIRKTRVTEIEAGGITQHIGAYHVATEKGQIVFLDTPGHEAFSAMRSRGAKVTDIVVLVVAADDGVMPQTVEAINHSKVAKVPIIVAINKIDKPNADPARVQRELSDVGLVSEEWGGETIFVQVSAKQNKGINDLLDMILLQAEILELKANPNKLATGHVVEAKLDSGRGPVATVLVQDGTLNTGDSVVCGIHYGKVRALLNDRGQTVKSAGPSIPVEIIGLSGVPMAGDEMVALTDEKNAKQISLHRIQKQRAKELAKTSRLSLDKLFEKMKQGEIKDLNLIIKADVDGSIEALRDSLVKLSNVEVNINVIHAATGTITESDISLAAVSNAIIIGFNVRPNTKVQDLAHEEHVDIRYHNIIYNVIKEIKDAIIGMMESTFEERVLGRCEVRQIFHVPKVGTIAGSYVTDGKIERGQLVRLLRDGIVTFEGRLSSLRRFKDDVKEALTGYECGIGIENYNDIKVGDIIECYYLEEIRPEMG
jgi:translation initiation factor IF-2